MNITSIIFLLGFIILSVNTIYIKYLTEQKPNKTPYLICRTGDYKGQSHTIKDWRKIAIELAKNTKNSRLNAMAKYGTDEDVIGLLYLNFGVELFDE
ncbi:MAG: hypothetical protein J6S67_02210 [Methanobrevibacter sp.]|nr:hypothetical protein [Methanobrevibacter sp.]